MRASKGASKSCLRGKERALSGDADELQIIEPGGGKATNLMSVDQILESPGNILEPLESLTSGDVVRRCRKQNCRSKSSSYEDDLWQ